MTTTNLALIGGVVVLVLLMLKLRRDKASTGGSKAAKPAKASTTARSLKVPKGPKLRVPKRDGASTTSAATESSTGGRRKGKRTAPVTTGPAGDWPEVAATAEPQAEPDWDAMRADAAGPRDTPVSAEIISPPAAPAWEPADVVTAPGWPLPGDVDVSWEATAPASDDASGAWLPTADEPADLNDEVSDWLGSDDDAAFETAITPPAVTEPGWQEPEADASWDTVVPADLAAQALAETQITGDAPSWISDDEAPVETPAWAAAAPDWADPTGTPVAAPAEPNFAEAFSAATLAPEPTRLGADEPEVTVELEPEADLDDVHLFATGLTVSEPEPDLDAPEWFPAAKETSSTATDEAAAVVEELVVEQPAPVNEPAPWVPAEDLLPAPLAEAPARFANTLEESASELTGRFALGGFAVETGHTALTSAMFRDPLVTVPTRWSIANGSAYAPGTIVLHVEATLNCEASDLEVAMEPAFAPTAYGATLRLAARGAGPFAASGTFQLIP